MIENQNEKLTDSAAFLSGRESIVVFPVANQFGAAAVPVSGCRMRDLPRRSETSRTARSVSDAGANAQMSVR